MKPASIYGKRQIDDENAEKVGGENKEAVGKPDGISQWKTVS